MRTAILALPLLALAAPALAEDWWDTFHLPSGNIHCLAADDELMGTFVDCEIIETTASPLQPRPDWCDLDWGRRFSLSEAGPASLGCTGDTVRHSEGRVLEYGEIARYGEIRCFSSSRGLECRNADGHGFMLSRAQQSLF